MTVQLQVGNELLYFSDILPQRTQNQENNEKGLLALMKEIIGSEVV